MISTNYNNSLRSYYYLNITVKNRNRYLAVLKIYQNQVSNMSDYAALAQCCNTTQVPLINSFNSMIGSYSLDDMDYTNNSLTFILVPNDTNAIVTLNGLDYLTQPKSLTPSVGNNHIEIVVTAQDPGFTNTYTVDFYVRGTTCSLSSLISDYSLNPLFNSAILNYTIFVNYYDTSVPLLIYATDPLSTIVLNEQNNMVASLAEVSKNISFSTGLSLTLNVDVIAETQSYFSNYTILIVRNDACGNGVRYSPLEQCDDRNLVSGDGCSSACMVESG